MSSLLAVQAENHAQSSWAVAARTTGITERDFAAAFDAGDVLRTHVIRPTWHYVTPDDIGWLLALTGPRIWRSTHRAAMAAHGIDERQLDRAAEIMTAAIGLDGDLSRDDIAARLAAEGLPSDGQAVAHQLAWAELHGLVCSGAMRDGTHTYALLDQRAPDRRRLDRDEALAEVALRYFTGHGPATERDLAYWATLTLTDVRAGIAHVADRLESLDHDGRTHWYAPTDVGPPGPDVAIETRGHILQILDECYRGYQDSRWIIDAAGLAPRGREPSTGMLLVDAQIVGDMTRTLRSEVVEFACRTHRDLDDTDVAAIVAAAARYGRFLDRTPTITWSRT